MNEYALRRLILCRVARERNAVGVQSCVMLQGKEMPEALDKGSQPYSRAFRHREPTVTVRASEGK